MKRGKPLKRMTPLARPTKPLSRSKGLKRTMRHASPSKAQRAVLSVSTMAVVHARQLGLCACGCGGKIAAVPIGYHHVLPKHKWPELIDVAENVVGVTANCHANHETRAKGLARVAVSLVERLPLDSRQVNYLERTYR